MAVRLPYRMKSGNLTKGHIVDHEIMDRLIHAHLSAEDAGDLDAAVAV